MTLTLALPTDPGDLSAALEVLGALGSLEHPHLVPLPVTRLSDRAVAVDTDDLPGVRLPQLLEGRRLSPGQVVTVGVPIAQGLDAAAARGVHHGAVDAASIVVEPSGKPTLLGCGLAQLAGARPTAADDVHALARLLAGLMDPLAGAEGAAVSAALAGALSGHPAGRPRAGALAAALLTAVPARPLPAADPDAPVPGVRTIVPPPRVRSREDRLREAVAGLRHRVGDLPRVPRPVLIGVPALIAVVVAVAVLGHQPPSHQVALPPAVPAPVASPSPAAPSPATDWQSILTGLATARQEAFAQADAGLLAQADAAGSSALAVDTERVKAWRSAGVVLAGGPAAVTLRQVRSAGTAVAVLRINEATAAYDVVDVTTHGVVEHHGAGKVTAWTVTLVKGAAGWRTASVSR